MAVDRANSARPEFKLVELYRDGAHLMGAYANVFIMASLEPPDVAVVRESDRLIRLYARSYPDGLGMMVLIHTRSGPPNEETRTAIQRVYGDLRSFVRAAVYIVEGEGFVAAAKRGALTLMNLTAKPAFPTKVASTNEDASVALRRALGEHWLPELQPTALAREVGNLRASLSPLSKRNAR